MLCCGYILTDFPISIRHTSLALWQSNDCPSASTYVMGTHISYDITTKIHSETLCIIHGISINTCLSHAFLPIGLSGRRGIVIACVCPSVRPSVCLSVRKLYLVRTITRHRFASNMHHGILSAGIENGGHRPWPSRLFWPFRLRILGNSACPRDNSSRMWARITKCARNMHPGMPSVYIDNRGELTLTLNAILAILTQNFRKFGLSVW